MNHNLTFTPVAFDNYKEWAISDKKIFKKINDLIQSIDRTPFEGIGKPEPLKYQYKGYWSRKITDEHRLVYTVNETDILFISSENNDNN